MKHTASKLIIIFGILFFFQSACESFWLNETDDCENPDYSDCDSFEPFFADLKMKITDDPLCEIQKIELFYGEIETADTLEVISEFAENSELLSITVSTDAEYSAKAYYRKGADTVICVDGTNFRKRSYTNCDSTCWYVTGDLLDLSMIDY
jgi:hypothetical protein